jgi:molybdenum cofactor biosynthesis protein MoaC
MVDITHKNSTLRKATAEAWIEVSALTTIEAITEGKVPKGNVLEVARTAGLFGVKRTSDLIPDCHPLPVEFTQVNYEFHGLKVRILVEVHTVYKTGVEVEAMTGASIVALTMYDMLKPIDKSVVISSIGLVSKTGGKSQQKTNLTLNRARVVVCSDRIHSGMAEDRSGQFLVENFRRIGLQTDGLVVIPDDSQAIRNEVERAHDGGIQVILFSGGTGVGPRDFTYSTLEDLMDEHLPGMVQYGLQYGQARIPTAMLGRAIAGISRGMLVLGIPGSLGAANDYFHAWFPACLHALDMVKGEGH